MSDFFDSPVGFILKALGTLVFCIIAYFTIGPGAHTRPSARLIAQAGPTSLTVVYEVRALPGVTDASSSLTYENESGNTEQHTVRLPWRLQFEAQEGQFLYISAQSDGYGNSCKIKVNGMTVEQADSSGQYSIASCSGMAE